MMKSLPSKELRLLPCFSEHGAFPCSSVHVFILMVAVIYSVAPFGSVRRMVNRSDETQI